MFHHVKELQFAERKAEVDQAVAPANGVMNWEVDEEKPEVALRGKKKATLKSKKGKK